MICTCGKCKFMRGPMAVDPDETHMSGLQSADFSSYNRTHILFILGNITAITTGYIIMRSSSTIKKIIFCTLPLIVEMMADQLTVEAQAVPGLDMVNSLAGAGGQNPLSGFPLLNGLVNGGDANKQQQQQQKPQESGKKEESGPKAGPQGGSPSAPAKQEAQQAEQKQQQAGPQGGSSPAPAQQQPSEGQSGQQSGPQSGAQPQEASEDQEEQQQPQRSGPQGGSAPSAQQQPESAASTGAPSQEQQGSGADAGPRSQSGGAKSSNPMVNEMLELVRKARGPGKPICLDSTLMKCAQDYADEMSANNREIDHKGLDGKNAQQRIKEKCNFKGTVTAENLADNKNIAEAHEALMKSPGHHVNIMKAEHNKLGIGIAKNAKGNLIVVQNFGANNEPCDNALNSDAAKGGEQGPQASGANGQTGNSPSGGKGASGGSPGSGEAARKPSTSAAPSVAGTSETASGGQGSAPSPSGAAASGSNTPASVGYQQQPKEPKSGCPSKSSNGQEPRQPDGDSGCPHKKLMGTLSNQIQNMTKNKKNATDTGMDEQVDKIIQEVAKIGAKL